MSSKNSRNRKDLNSEGVDKSIMMEMVVLYILLGMCLCGLFYVLVKIILSFQGGIAINMPG